MKTSIFRIMFRAVGIALIGALILGMAACGGGDDGDPSSNQTPIVDDYDINGNRIQSAGSVTAIIVTAKEGKSPGAVTVLYNGSATIPQTAANYTVTFNVAAATGWNAASGLSAGTLEVNNKATPTVTTWPTAETITYGAMLSSSELTGGVAEEEGTFAWTNGATIPTVTNSGYDVTFTPTDTANYNTLTHNVAIMVNKANPAVTWPTAATITYGAELSTSELTGGVGEGTFAWTNSTTRPTVTNSGYEVTFTPTDTANYNTLKQNVAIIVNKADPTVTWPTAAAITYGAALSTSVLTGGTGAGSFAWTNGATIPTVVNSGYEITFTPTNTANYNTLKKNVAITVYLVTTSGIELAWVSDGSFQMGTASGGGSDELPVHQVTLTTGFYMGKYEVTQEQYQALMGSNPSGNTTDAAAGETQSRRPVEQVSWYDALVFCNKLSAAEGLTPAYRINNSANPSDWGTVPTSSDATWNAAEIVSGSTGYRLPTEAQWEYAARGGPLASNPYKIYSGGDTVGNVAWYKDNSGNKTHEVGKKTANEIGLYDMSGNVAEWCWDWYGSYSSGAQIDPTGASTGSSRVTRGGSWYDSAADVRSAYRNLGNPSSRGVIIGFRIVRLSD